jgi:hypothetical protein
MASLIRVVLKKIGLLKQAVSIKRKMFPAVDIPEYSEKRAIILSYKEKYKPDIFVETGTLFGDTVQILSSNFKKLYSIELSEELAIKAKKRFDNLKHISIVQGDSGVEIDSILKIITEPVLFWLDGHYSGDFYHRDELIKTAKGVLNTPVEKELELIMQSGFPHIVLIDDAREFTGSNDYPTIKQLRHLLKKSKFGYQLSVDRDIIRIVPTNGI